MQLPRSVGYKPLSSIKPSVLPSVKDQSPTTIVVETPPVPLTPEQRRVELARKGIESGLTSIEQAELYRLNDAARANIGSHPRYANPLPSLIPKSVPIESVTLQSPKQVQPPITNGAVIGDITYHYHCNNCGHNFLSSRCIPQCPGCISYDCKQLDKAGPAPELNRTGYVPTSDEVKDGYWQNLEDSVIPISNELQPRYSPVDTDNQQVDNLIKHLVDSLGKHQIAHQPPIISQNVSPTMYITNDLIRDSVLPPQLELQSAPKHLIIEALAGTGKTFTIIEACYRAVGINRQGIVGSDEQEAIWAALPEKYAPSSIYMVAFNRNISNTLRSQVPPGVIASTAHGFGKRILGFHRIGTGKFGVYKKKHNKTFKILCASRGIDYKQIQSIAPYALLFTIAKLVSLMKLNLVTLTGDYPTDRDMIKGLVDTHGMTLPEFKKVEQEYLVFSEAIYVYNKSHEPEFTKCIDFDDMVWLPWKLNLTCRPYELMFVDERQDLNLAQQELVYQNAKRLVMVGDSHQAIYGFAGADVSACNRMETRLKESHRGVLTFPLTYTRRCSKAVVRYNQTIVPEFKHFDFNQEGGVYQDKEDQFLNKVSLGDMVVCRTNAPLFSCCLNLMKQRVPFKTTIKQFFEDTITLIKSFDCKDLTDLQYHLIEWRDRKLEACTGSKSDLAIVVMDQVEAIKVAIANSNSVNDLIVLLETVFKAGEDDDEDRLIGVSPKWIFLSSIHQSKGLEATRVWWLQYDLVPHPKARLLEQETNLRWVAGTRAIDDLILVKSVKHKTILDEELQDELRYACYESTSLR